MDATRFDAAARTLAQGLPRRRVLALLAGAGALFLPKSVMPAAARTSVTCTPLKCPTGQCSTCQIHEDGRGCTCRCEKCWSSGIAGGGAVAGADGGEAHLSLLATRQPVDEAGSAFTVLGQVRWTDPGWEGVGLTLTSAIVVFYGPLPEVENGREVIGYMESSQQSGDLPFVLHAIAANPGEPGTATVAIWVGDDILDDPAVAATFDPAPARTGFGYAAAGALTSGDLQLLSLAAMPSGPPATPVA